MSAALLTDLASLEITEGPTRYYLTQALANRHFQIFKLQGKPHAVRVDGLRPLHPESDPCHRWVITVFVRDSGETQEWFYDTELREGSTAIPSA